MKTAKTPRRKLSPEDSASEREYASGKVMIRNPEKPRNLRSIKTCAYVACWVTSLELSTEQQRDMILGSEIEGLFNLGLGILARPVMSTIPTAGLTPTQAAKAIFAAVGASQRRPSPYQLKELRKLLTERQLPYVDKRKQPTTSPKEAA